MARCRLHPLALAVTLLAPLLVALPSVRGEEAGAALDRGLFRELRWRPIGPFRGGRTKAATGVRGKPGLFYIGVVNGGVWKTTDYGRTWQPIFDDQPTGSIGAIAVAPSNPDVIYVGSGEGMQRPDLSTGDGIYRSTDGGKTWKHLGLRDGQQIPQIVVDPKDEKRLFVAVLGHPYGPNEERGVYRSTDGGETFQKVLYLDENTGAADVALDPSDPATVYAVLWESRQGPWENGEFSGEGSGLYKSTDGGLSWRPLKDGLPTFAEGLGRIGITVAPSQPRRLYATVEARDKAGLYRSDDAGERWSRVNSDPRVVARPDDAAEVGVHPTNPDVVFVPTIVTWKSTDGGKTFSGLPRRAGRRRLPAHLDRPRPARGDDPLVGPGGGGHGQRRGDVEQLVQPADRAVLPREHGQLLPVPRVRRAAGERLGLRAQPRRRRPDHLPRLAPGGGGGVRLRRARPARPRRGLRRQGEPVRPSHGPGAERVAAAAPWPGLPGRPDAARSLLADRPEDPLLRVQHAVEDDGRRAALGGDQPRPDAEGLAGAGERGEVPGHPGRRGDTAGGDLHRRPVAARRGAHLGRHRRRPRPRDARRREDLAGRDAAGARALGQGVAPRGLALRSRHGLGGGQHLPPRRHAAPRLPHARRREDLGARDGRDPAERGDRERRARGPEAQGPAVRGNGTAGLGLVRRGRPLAVPAAEHAGDVGAGPRGEGRRPRGGDARAGVLDPRQPHAAAAGGSGRPRGRGAPVRSGERAYASAGTRTPTRPCRRTSPRRRTRRTARRSTTT